MAIRIDMLRAFRVVAEKGALAEAAAAMGRTPSALSMTLSQLEAHLDGPLFEGDRKNRLTKLGKLVLEQAIRATDGFDASLQAIERLNASIAGTVRIAAVPSVSVSLLPNVIADFHLSHPDVRIEVSDLDTSAVQRRIRQDEADIGLITAKSSDTGDGVLVWRDDLGIACQKGGRIDQAINGGAGQSWALLQLEPLIGNPLCALLPEGGAFAADQGATLFARNTTTLIAFVRQGLGATVLPQAALSHVGEDIRFVATKDPKVTRDVRMICAAERSLAPAAQAFWERLAERAGSGVKALR